MVKSWVSKIHIKISVLIKLLYIRTAAILIIICCPNHQMVILHWPRQFSLNVMSISNRYIGGVDAMQRKVQYTVYARIDILYIIYQ